jgi:nucleolin
MVPVKAVPVKNGEDETSEEESELEEEPKPVAKAIKAPAKKDESSSEEDEEDSDDEEVIWLHSRKVLLKMHMIVIIIHYSQ